MPMIGFSTIMIEIEFLNVTEIWEKDSAEVLEMAKHIFLVICSEVETFLIIYSRRLRTLQISYRLTKSFQNRSRWSTPTIRFATASQRPFNRIDNCDVKHLFDGSSTCECLTRGRATTTTKRRNDTHR